MGGVLSQPCLQLPAMRVQGGDLGLEGDDLRLQGQNQRSALSGQCVPDGGRQRRSNGVHAADILHRSPPRNSAVIPRGGGRERLPLEQLRDLYDHGRFGLVLIGLPGLERRLVRYAQFSFRVGFVHQFRPLSAEDLQAVLRSYWQGLGLPLQPEDAASAEALAAIVRLTGGNFRLVQRLFSQIERVLQVNELRVVTKEVVEAARETLVIGSS